MREPLSMRSASDYARASFPRSCTMISVDGSGDGGGAAGGSVPLPASLPLRPCSDTARHSLPAPAMPGDDAPQQSIQQKAPASSFTAANWAPAPKADSAGEN